MRLLIRKATCSECKDGPSGKTYCIGECDPEIVPAQSQLIALSNELKDLDEKLLNGGGDSIVNSTGEMVSQDYAGEISALKYAIAKLVPRFYRGVRNS